MEEEQAGRTDTADGHRSPRARATSQTVSCKEVQEKRVRGIKLQKDFKFSLVNIVPVQAMRKTKNIQAAFGIMQSAVHNWTP